MLNDGTKAKQVKSVGAAPADAPAEPQERPVGAFPILPEGTDVRIISDALRAHARAQGKPDYGGAEGKGGLYSCPVHEDGDRPNLNLAVGDKVPAVVTCLVCRDEYETRDFYIEVLDALGIGYLPGVRPSEDDVVNWGPHSESYGGSGGSAGPAWDDIEEGWKRYGVAFYPYPDEDGHRYGLVIRDEAYDPETGKRVAKHVRPYHWVEDATPARRRRIGYDRDGVEVYRVPDTEHWADTLEDAPADVRRYVGRPYRWRLGWPDGPRTPMWWSERESWQGENLHWPEGEKDVETLRARGLHATTYPFNRLPDDPETLREHLGDVKRVVLLGDLDKAGFASVRRRGRALKAAGYEGKILTRFVDRAKFEQATDGRSADKADVTDWLNAGLPLKEMVSMAKAELAEAPEPDPEPEQAEPEPEAKKKPATKGDLPKNEGPPLAVRLRLHVEKHYDVFPAGDDERIFAMPKSGGRAEKMGTGFVLRAAPKLGLSAANLSTAAAEAAKVLAARAEDRKPRPLALRAHYRTGRIVLDLAQPGNTKCVVVTPDGWSVEDVPPKGVVFQEYGRPLPLPERGGNIEEFREFLRWAEDDPHWPLIKGWLPASLLTDRPRPLLGVFGPAGSAKTATCRFVVSLIDPKPAGVLGSAFGKRQDDETKALASYLPSWDNVSALTGEGSDFVARLVTGDLIERRKLYSDSDLASISYHRTGVVNGVNVPRGLKADALDRMILIRVQPLTGERLTEEQLDAEWKRVRPRVLAGVLDLAVKMLAGLRDGEAPDDLPRMADYAKALHAIDPALYEAYLANVAEARADMASDDPLIAAVVGWMQDRPTGTWEGTAEQLRNAVLDHHSEDEPAWPKSGRGFWDQVNLARELLKAAGVEVTERRGHGGSRLKKFEWKG